MTLFRTDSELEMANKYSAVIMSLHQADQQSSLSLLVYSEQQQFCIYVLIILANTIKGARTSNSKYSVS